MTETRGRLTEALQVKSGVIKRSAVRSDKASHLRVRYVRLARLLRFTH
jgi:hypothetical protein